ncbi:MAG TPA: hypothetical protein VMH28_01680 [Candidatus Acidoferrales bacterium]|nr:hypothetical protein [Candidatus Acidoferrales bacterium]
MTDYTYPSVYFAYFFFAISAGVCLFFLVRSWKDGYWGDKGEEVKYQVFDEEVGEGRDGRK